MNIIFNFSLLKFEFKKILTDFLFWAMLLLSMFFIIQNIISLFKLPVLSNKQAFDFLTTTDAKGDYNIYHIKLSDIFDKYNNILINKKSQNLWEIKNYDDLVLVDKNFNNIKNDINIKIKNDIGNIKFSKIFFKISSITLIEYSRLMLTVFFPIVWYRDKLYKSTSLVKTTPIKQSQYLFCKFISGFIIYITFLFLILFIIAVIAKLKFAKLDFNFKISDMISPFVLFIIPQLLFFSILLSSLTLLFKKAILSSAVFYLIMFTDIFPDKLKLFSIDAITGYHKNWVYIPPINIYYGLRYQIIFIISSIFIFYLSCKIWSNFYIGDE